MDYINSIYEAHKNDHSVGRYNKNRNSYSSSYSSKSYSSGTKKNTPSYPAGTYNSSYSTNRNDSYDVYNYDNPDDFTDDWAEKFGDGDYDNG